MRARLIIVLVLALLLASCGDDDRLTTTSTAGDVTTSSSPTTTGGEVSTTTEGVTTTTGPGGESAWERVPHDESVFGGEGYQSMWSVAAGGPGLVAIGSDDISDGGRDAAVWTSPDGSAWTRVPHDAAVFGGGQAEMSDVVAGGPGLVAVGSDAYGGGLPDAAVWTSTDGLTWTRVPHDEAVFGGEGFQGMWGVAVGGPGLVGVGYTDNGTDLDAAVWTSADGLTWAPVPVDESIVGGPSEQVMVRVAAGGPGVVAIGWDFSGGDEDAAVWTSTDGLTWSRVAHDEVVFGGAGGQEMRAITAGGPGLVVVGFDMSRRSAARMPSRAELMMPPA